MRPGDLVSCTPHHFEHMVLWAHPVVLMDEPDADGSYIKGPNHVVGHMEWGAVGMVVSIDPKGEALVLWNGGLGWNHVRYFEALT